MPAWRHQSTTSTLAQLERHWMRLPRILRTPLYRRRFQERRSLMPGRSLPSFRIAIVEQGAEIRRIKFFVLHVREIGFDIGEVVIDAVALGRRTAAADVIATAAIDHRRNSAAADLRQAPLPP